MTPSRGDRKVGLAIGLALIVGILPWPYVYYVLLRVAVCGGCTWLVHKALQAKDSNRAWFMGGIAVLFNPIFPIFLSRSVWRAIDLVFGVALIGSTYGRSSR